MGPGLLLLRDGVAENLVVSIKYLLFYCIYYYYGIYDTTALLFIITVLTAAEGTASAMVSRVFVLLEPLSNDDFRPFFGRSLFLMLPGRASGSVWPDSAS